MKKNDKRIVKLLTLGFALLLTLNTVNAYNGKFSFSITSGWLSPWIYSAYVYKVTTDEAPVVTATYTTGSTNNFTYTVVNANHEDRVTQFTQSGTFGLRTFQNSTMVQNYVYKLGAKRDGGAWNSSATVQGLWNPDSY